MADQPDSISSQRRGSERLPMHMRVSLKSGQMEGEVWFNTRDISEGGVYLLSNFLLEKGDPVTLWFDTPKQTRAAEVEGKVAWVNLGFDEASEKIPAGMGIAFETLSDQAVKVIRQILLQSTQG